MQPSRLVRRWVVAYLLLYCLFFPLWQLVDVAPWVAVHERPWLALVTWVGDAVFGVDAAPRLDSPLGDQTYFFVSAACRVVAACALALAWAPTERQAERVRSYVAVYLAVEMTMYGWYKLIPTQMPAFGPDRAILPLGDFNPQGLLWAFMGASAPYQMAAGLAEVVAGALLFWRPTRPLGVTLALVVLANVVLLNFCYDVGVKLHSIHLVVMALFIGQADLRRVFAALWGTSSVPPRVVDPHPIASVRARRAVWASKLALCVGVSVLSAQVCLRVMTTVGELAPPSPLHGVHRVVAFTRDGRADAPEQLRWLRVGINQEGAATIQLADGSGAFYLLKIDEENHTLTFMHPGDPGFTLDLERPADGELRLSGVVDGVHIVAELRGDTYEPLLTYAPFHMMQDYHVYVDPRR